MFGRAARFVLGAPFVLGRVGGAEAREPGSSRAALATFEVEGERLRWIRWATLVVIGARPRDRRRRGSDQAAWLAAGLLALFAAALVGAILRGRGRGALCLLRLPLRPSDGRRCGATSASPPASSPFPCCRAEPVDRPVARDRLGVALLLCLGLGVAVVALAREVGMLRLRLGPAAALEVPEEGRSPASDWR